MAATSRDWILSSKLVEVFGAPQSIQLISSALLGYVVCLGIYRRKHVLLVQPMSSVQNN